MKRYMAIFLAIFFMLSPLQAQTFPELTGRVVDEAGLLSAGQEAQLTQKLQALEDQSGRQLVVATVSDLQGYPIEDYGYQLGRTWGIGSAERDDGTILLVAPNERKVRIEVGYGLEGIMTDALSSIIIQNDILPNFRNGDMAAGIIAGVDTINTQLTLPEDEARAYAQSLERQQRDRDSEGNYGMLIFWALILIFFVLPAIFSSRKGKRYRGGSGPIIIWGPGTGSSWGGSGGGFGGGGFGGGGFGGGGFGGGGGGFGGGGASGGW
ncbi:YgcG family protein [Sphingorhabdus sp. Alg239-R122]|uniref:TPM domain-containing protein n=1 Tax=Sphingorhabdus sp. Alg239-R122 TaxID=2305989 RepID=UPI0013DA5D93|nr:YgcG family protein [Sphingorhabdus sp. Alg239-R122]